MRKNLPEEQPVRVLARRAAMSERTFARLFAAETGTTPGRWLLAQRVHHARTLLESSDLSVETVASRCGFGSAAQVRHHFGAHEGGRAGGVPPYVPDTGRARRLKQVPPRVRAMPYPPAPWNLHGQLWLSLFRVRDGDHPDREPGVYGAALVSYETPSPLTYSELLVARAVKRAGGRRVHITDIWVDSSDSLQGGRALWAIPKDLCEFQRTTTGGRVQRTSWSTTLDGAPIATAGFTDVTRNIPRAPFKGSTWQQRAAGGSGADREVVAHIKGSAKAFPAHGSWDFDRSGPLAWLAGKRPLASFRMTDFQMSFG